MQNPDHPTWGGRRPGQGRPKSEDKKQAVQIRFSAAEKSQLETAAALSGKTFSAFVRDAALQAATTLSTPEN